MQKLKMHSVHVTEQKLKSQNQILSALSNTDLPRLIMGLLPNKPIFEPL